MRITKYIKSFISGMMMVRFKTLTEEVEKLRKLPFDWEMCRKLQELERIQPKRKYKKRKKK